MSLRLCEEQICHFHRSGYLVVSGVFTPDEAREMRVEAGRILELCINSSLANHRRSGRLDVKAASGGAQVVRKIQPVVDISPPFSALAEDERLKGPMRQLQGEEPVLMEEKFSYRQRLPEPIRGIDARGVEDRFLLHQDYAYHRAHGYPPTIVTSGVVIDDCTAESGPIRVWPGTHRAYLPHETVMIGSHRGYELSAVDLDPRGAVDVIAPAGAVVFFHDLLVHCSSANRTERPRRILLFSYCPRSTAMPSDARRGPARAAERPYERTYQTLKEQGLFTDVFHTPAEP